MTELWSVIDGAVGEALDAHADYLTSKGQDRARKLIVGRVTRALREALTTPQAKQDGEPAETSTSEPNQVRMGAWSREWWAALIRRVERGEPTDFMMRCAASGGVWVGESEPIDNATIATMKAYPADSEQVAQWRTWFKEHRVNLPEWRERVWVFLPTTGPPLEKTT